MSLAESSGSDFKPLTGTDETSLDEKGRLVVSKKKRERLGDNFAIAISEIGCLAIYPERTWQSILAEVQSVGAINKGRQIFARLVIGTAEDELSCDANGRVLIPAHLRKEAKIKDKVVVIGAMDRIEIWAKEEYDAFTADPLSYGKQREGLIDQARTLMGVS
jgi:MraZ protein